MGPSLYGCVAAALRLILHRRHRPLLLGCGQSALGGKFWLSLHQRTLQVCFSLLGMRALFVLFKGWLWVGAWKVLGVSVPLPPCSRAHRSPSTLLGGRGVADGCRSQGCHGSPTTRLLCTGLSWLPYALGYCAPLSFQAPSPSSSIVDEFK